MTDKIKNDIIPFLKLAGGFLTFTIALWSFISGDVISKTFHRAPDIHARALSTTSDAMSLLVSVRNDGYDSASASRAHLIVDGNEMKAISLSLQNGIELIEGKQAAPMILVSNGNLIPTPVPDFFNGSSECELLIDIQEAGGEDLAPAKATFSCIYASVQLPPKR